MRVRPYLWLICLAGTALHCGGRESEETTPVRYYRRPLEVRADGSARVSARRRERDANAQGAPGDGERSEGDSLRERRESMQLEQQQGLGFMESQNSRR